MRHPHCLAVARSSVGGPGSLLSVVGNSGARVGNTPRALEGQGRKAVHGRPIGSPLGHGSIVIRSRRHGNQRARSAGFYCNGGSGRQGLQAPRVLRALQMRGRQRMLRQLLLSTPFQVIALRRLAHRLLQPPGAQRWHRRPAAQTPARAKAPMPVRRTGRCSRFFAKQEFAFPLPTSFCNRC